MGKTYSIGRCYFDYYSFCYTVASPFPHLPLCTKIYSVDGRQQRRFQSRDALASIMHKLLQNFTLHIYIAAWSSPPIQVYHFGRLSLIHSFHLITQYIHFIIVSPFAVNRWHCIAFLLHQQGRCPHSFLLSNFKLDCSCQRRWIRSFLISHQCRLFTPHHSYAVQFPLDALNNISFVHVIVLVVGVHNIQVIHSYSPIGSFKQLGSSNS